MSVAFAGGFLPSQYPEAQKLPNVQRFLAEQIDMQFADIRVLLRLPEPTIDPHVGANFTAATAILGQISGLSIWLFHNAAAKRIRTREVKEKRKMPLSGLRFKSFVRSYYPRVAGEPTVLTIANHLYDTRNVLSHSLGIGEVVKMKGRRNVDIVKPDPALSEQDVVDLEKFPLFPLVGVPVERRGSRTLLYVPGLYWALGRMLRAALQDQPGRCEAAVAPALKMFPSASNSP
jgi:hypothetical protein